MEEREEEYQRARERIFAHEVRAVCVGGGRWGWGACCTNLCVVSIHVQIQSHFLPPITDGGFMSYYFICIFSDVEPNLSRFLSRCAKVEGAPGNAACLYFSRVNKTD